MLNLTPKPAQTIITNELSTCITGIVDLDKTLNSDELSLTLSCNKSGSTSSELFDLYNQAINGMIGTSTAVKASLKPANMLIHGRLKQSAKLHSVTVVQNSLESLGLTVTEIGKVLSHVSITQDGVLFTKIENKKKYSNGSVYDCLSDSIMVIGSPTLNKETKAYDNNVTVHKFDALELFYAYNDYMDNLSDKTPDLVSDATTTPDATIDTVDTLDTIDTLDTLDTLDSVDSVDSVDVEPFPVTMLKKELVNSRQVVAIKEQDIQNSFDSIASLTQRIVELELENQLLFSELSPTKQRKIKAA